MGKLKSMLLGFVKPLVLAHISDLSMLSPLLAGVIVNKAKLPQDQANALAADLVTVVETELTALINKI
jgi:hypothetical protein